MKHFIKLKETQSDLKDYRSEEEARPSGEPSEGSGSEEHMPLMPLMATLTPHGVMTTVRRAGECVSGSVTVCPGDD